MTLNDMPVEEMQAYKPEPVEPSDFDSFWARNLSRTRSQPIDARFVRADFGLRAIETYDVTFNGFEGQPVKGWFLLPRNRSGRLPCVIQYVGYGGGRGFPVDWLLWSCAGYANLVMDSRGQGSEWLKGDTSDLPPDGSPPHYPGFVTEGILNPESYYYKRLILDAVRAVDAARSREEVDPMRVVVTGHSQGGGLSLAVAGLVNDLACVMPDAPFLCDTRRAVRITDAKPYSEIVSFLRAHRDVGVKVFETLSYFDGVNFARRARVRAYFSVALMDEVCPPSTGYAAFNHYAGPKHLDLWEFSNHEAGGSHQQVRQIGYMRTLFGAPAASKTRTS